MIDELVNKKGFKVRDIVMVTRDSPHGLELKKYDLMVVEGVRYEYVVVSKLSTLQGSILSINNDYLMFIENGVPIEPDADDGSICLKVKRLDFHASMPKYANPGDAGLDLVAIDDGKIPLISGTKSSENNEQTTEYIEYRTGVSIEIPKGYVGLIYPRSSISNTSLSLSNSVGVIDSGYRGEIKFRFRILNDNPIKYRKGDKIGQLILMPIPTVRVEEALSLSESTRGAGGFGSTGS